MTLFQKSYISSLLSVLTPPSHKHSLYTAKNVSVLTFIVTLDLVLALPGETLLLKPAACLASCVDTTQLKLAWNNIWPVSLLSRALLKPENEASFLSDTVCRLLWNMGVIINDKKTKNPTCMLTEHIKDVMKDNKTKTNKLCMTAGHCRL